MQLEYAHVSTIVVMLASTLVCVSSCMCTCIHICTCAYMLGRGLSVRVNSVFQIVFCERTSVDSLKYTCIFLLDVLFTNMFVKEPYICISTAIVSTLTNVCRHMVISGRSLRIVNMSAADFRTRALHICKRTLCVCVFTRYVPRSVFLFSEDRIH